MEILSIKNLSKSFASNKVIDNLTFSVQESSIYGFLGQNGAGKTTTMKMILGLLAPTSGNISVCGEAVRYGETKTNRYIGFLPDVPEFYGFMKPTEYLSLCGEITEIDKVKAKKRIGELISIVGLEKANKKISGFSRGMKQRLGIAQALLNEPRLLICDEPTSALDPIGRKEILDILLSVKGKTTIVFSTHILTDVERICDNVAVLHQGKLKLSGTLSEIKSQNRQDCMFIEFGTKTDKDDFLEHDAFRFFPDVSNAETSVTIKTTKIKELQKIVFELANETTIYPIKVELLEPTLENLFMEAVK